MSYTNQLVIATGNQSKGAEMMEILHEGLHGSGVELLTLSDFPGANADVEEIGETFAENAEIKVRAAVAATGCVCIADDGGLCIDALGGRPGVHSKRFLGENAPFEEKMTRILQMMVDVPSERRTCRFRCAVAIAIPEGSVRLCEGVCEGVVAREMRGEFGFGYDPIVYLPQLGRHMAELPPREKHKISHRGRALVCAIPILQAIFAGRATGTVEP